MKLIRCRNLKGGKMTKTKTERSALKVQLAHRFCETVKPGADEHMIAFQCGWDARNKLAEAEINQLTYELDKSRQDHSRIIEKQAAEIAELKKMRVFSKGPHALVHKDLLSHLEERNQKQAELIEKMAMTLNWLKGYIHNYCIISKIDEALAEYEKFKGDAK